MTKTLYSARLPQIFIFGIGEVRGNIFYHLNGLNHLYGRNAPALLLVSERKAKPRGRPRKTNAPGTGGAPTIDAYALDVEGAWWSVRYGKGVTAKVRTVKNPPYGTLGRGYWGRTSEWKAKAKAELRAAMAAYLHAQDVAALRAKCDLI